MNRLIAIGDIHGCAHALDTVLDAIQPTSDDTIVILGDFIDAGRDTNSVIDRCLQLQHECELVTIRGNHEEMMLNALNDTGLKHQWDELGGYYTLNSYGFLSDIDGIPEPHIDFIQQTLDHYESETHIFTHACYRPELPIVDQPEHVLRWEMLEPPYPQPHFSGKTVLVGHTEQKSCEVLDFGHLICLDTYCREFGWLSAMDVLSGTLWQANRWGALRNGNESVENQRVAVSYLKNSAISS